MVSRAGFGFNAPSVAETDETFRVNVGLVPLVYAKLVALALFETCQFFENLAVSPNLVVPPALANVESLKSSHSLLQALIQKVNSKCTMLFELMREPWRMDVLVDLIWTKQQPVDGERALCSHSMLFNALQMINKCTYMSHGKKFTFSGTGISDLIVWRRPCSWSNQPVADKRLEFEGIDEWRESMRRVFQSLGHDDETASEDVYGCFFELDRANAAFIRAHWDDEGEDGYGSDSGDEWKNDEDNIRYARTLRVHTGMKAICLAISLAQHHLAQNLRHFSISSAYMYYETTLVLENINVPNLIRGRFKIIHRKPNKVDGEPSENVLLMYDINHFNKNNEHYNDRTLDFCLKKTEPKTVILDHTSSTSSQLSDAINQCFGCNTVTLVLLVLSGIKHEQAGADYSPYGEMRIISRGKNGKTNTQWLYERAKELLDTDDPKGNNKVPAVTHCLVKAYQNSGHAFSLSHIWNRVTAESPQKTARELNFTSPNKKEKKEKKERMTG